MLVYWTAIPVNVNPGWIGEDFPKKWYTTANIGTYQGLVYESELHYQSILPVGSTLFVEWQISPNRRFHRSSWAMDAARISWWHCQRYSPDWWDELHWCEISCRINTEEIYFYNRWEPHSDDLSVGKGERLAPLFVGWIQLNYPLKIFFLAPCRLHSPGIGVYSYVVQREFLGTERERVFWTIWECVRCSVQVLFVFECHRGPQDFINME